MSLTMAMKRINKQGFTLIEVVATSAIVAIIALVLVKVFSYTIRYFHSVSVRQQLQSDADRTLNLLTNTLLQAQSHTVSICSCGAIACSPNCNQVNTKPPNPPNDRIEFVQVGSNSNSAIYWSNYTIFMQVGQTGSQPLAHNATGLMFTGDATDFSRVWISFQLEKWSSQNEVATVTIPNQAVRLAP
jgi:prepilin-type N-terminal cleavage/methylation domain-containing protein